MKKLLILLNLCCLLLLPLAFYAQHTPAKSKGYVWSPQAKTYMVRKVNGIANLPAVTAVKSELTYVTAMGMENYIWIIPNSPSQPGYWTKARADTDPIRERLKMRAPYLYPISINNYSAYPYRGQNSRGGDIPLAPARPFNINSIKENYNRLAEDEVSGAWVLNEPDQKTMVYYAKKINLGLIVMGRKYDVILVTDTLYVPPAEPFKTAIISNLSASSPYLKIIAKCIVYESPISLALLSGHEADFVFSTPSIYFKCPYKNLSGLYAPPLVTTSEPTNYIHRDGFGDNEQILLCRLYVASMEQCLSSLLSTTDPWKRDKLVTEFLKIRYSSIDQASLVKDPGSKQKFIRLCTDYDSKIGSSYKLEKTRDLNGSKILVSGGDGKPLKYYTLPQLASLVPRLDKNHSGLLGSMLYNPTGEAKLRLTLDADLEYDTLLLQKVRAALQPKNIQLEHQLPADLFSIKEQPLKIRGKTVGSIIPVSNRTVRLEINLAEEGKSIIELFPKIGRTTFKIDFDFFTDTGAIPFTQEVSLQVDRLLLDQLDYSQPLKSFEILENTGLTENVELISNLDASLPNEGVLYWIEVLLEIQDAGEVVLRGPYRLSAYNTLAARMTIPVLKKSQAMQIVVSGRAMYENGERNIVPFETKDMIIQMSENVFVEE